MLPFSKRPEVVPATGGRSLKLAIRLRRANPQIFLVIPAGVEPAIFWMRTRRPGPLDDGTELSYFIINPLFPQDWCKTPYTLIIPHLTKKVKSVILIL